jgi:predicted nucleotidyltransferase
VDGVSKSTPNDLAIGAEVPVSRSPAAVEMVREYIRGSCRTILDRVGPENAVAVVVSGSAALGEMTAVDLEDGGPLVLSDVDLALVVKSDQLRESVKSMKSAIIEEIAGLPAASRMCPRPELGVYSVRDLEIQDRKMGVLELRDSGVVIWGDVGVLDGLPRFGPEEIPREEAVALLFNRCLEMLEALEDRTSEDARRSWLLLYACAKAYLDAGTALAVYSGRYVPGYEPRLDRTRRVIEDGWEDLRAVIPSEFLRGLGFWTDFKLDPDLSRVNERYEIAGARATLGDAAWRSFLEAGFVLPAVWAALVGGQGADAGSGVIGACRSLLGREPLPARLRGWKRVFMGGDVPLTRAARLAFAGSPLRLLRLSAMCLLDRYASEGRGRREGLEGTETVIPSLDESAAGFLRAYFPGAIQGGMRDEDAESWRRLIVEVWRRWTERFWS